MAFSRAITHPFVSAIADGSDATLVRPSNWNAGHTQAISGAVSGGIPYFSSTTSEGTSALLAAGGIVLGGGAGNPPATDANLTYSATTFSVGWSGTPVLSATASSITAAQPIIVPAGTAGAPVLRGPNSTQGLFFPDANTMSYVAGGTRFFNLANDYLNLSQGAGFRFWSGDFAAVTSIISQTAAGLTLAAGTATTDVAALSVTRTNNNSAVATGVKFAFTDTSSAVGFEALGVYGGASANTKLLTVGKAGVLTVGSNVVPSTNGGGSLGSAAVGFSALYLDYTNTATVGNVTINKPSGRVIMGAGGTTFTLTNSLITANSHIFLSADSAPGNVVAVQFYAVPAAGSCTINAVPAVTNQTNIDFFIANAD